MNNQHTRDLPKSDPRESLEGRMIPLSSVFGLMECSICLEVVKIPFKQCKMGHLTCCSCLATLTACPICTVTVFHENSTVFKQLLESLPRLCRHSANGCKLVVEPGDDHEKYCGFRSVKCVHRESCDEKVPVYQLLEHYRNDHHPLAYTQPEGEIIRPVALLGNCVSIISTLGHFFWLDENFNKDAVELTVHMYHMGAEPDKDHFIRLQLKKFHQEITYVLKASVNCENDDANCSMKLDRSSFDWFAKDGWVNIEYDIYTKPKQG